MPFWLSVKISASSHIQRPKEARMLRIASWVAFGLAVTFALFSFCAMRMYPREIFGETPKGASTTYTIEWSPHGVELSYGVILLCLLNWVLLLIAAKRSESAARS
jgi:hypothetical protein